MGGGSAVCVGAGGGARRWQVTKVAAASAWTTMGGEVFLFFKKTDLFDGPDWERLQEIFSTVAPKFNSPIV